MIDPRTPILVGAGQITDTVGTPSSERSRVAFCAEAANAALEDTKAGIGGHALEMESAPWQLLAPSGVLALVLLCLNFIGDGLRDALDPRLGR